MDFLSKVLNYESSIFEEYSSKRKDFIKNIKNKVNLDKEQTVVFINDIKAVIDPIKMSISAIDHYLENVDFKNNESVLAHNELCAMIYLFLGLRLTSLSESELTLETERLSESEEISESDDSLSELKSSRSVSDTFSSKNCFE